MNFLSVTPTFQSALAGWKTGVTPLVQSGDESAALQTLREVGCPESATAGKGLSLRFHSITRNHVASKHGLTCKFEITR